MNTLSQDETTDLLMQIAEAYNWSDTDTDLLVKTVTDKHVTISDIINIFQLNNCYGPKEVITKIAFLFN